MLTEDDLGHMNWLRAYQDREVCLVGDDDLTKGRTLYLQMLYEFSIMSISLPDIDKPNMIPENEYTSEDPLLSFEIPESHRNRKLKGLNLTFKYTLQGDEWVWFARIRTNNGVNLIYNAKVFGKPAADEVGIWLSYWPIGKSLRVGDEVNVSIIVTNGLEINGCGASLVYAGEEDEDEYVEDSNKSFVENHESFEDANDFYKDNNEHADILGGDISGFKLSKGTYYLCRRDYSQLMEVGRLTPNWFRDLVGDTIDYTEIGGWRKTGRPDQPYRSYRKLKTDGCIIYGPHLEELYKIEELSESSLSDKTEECTSEFSKDATKDKDESADLETTNLSKSFDFNEIWESTSIPHGDSAATKDNDESANLETTNLSKAFDSDEIWESTSIPHGDSAATKATKTLGSSYDVFVSFQGEDTRNSFTNHLYDALKKAGISTSLDIEAIHRGEKLESQIKTQIEQSKVSIVVISEAYATSALCLDELAFILEQRRRRNHQILPVFYNVIPSDIWREYGSLSFIVDDTSIWTNHNRQRWKEALKDVANISGMLISRYVSLFLSHNLVLFSSVTT
ncbi:Leucine-rich repeat-containing protein [Artemisia annua]|uniref:Leucine-rich repeat-containing protein n=1 Tax=Artemisia annua TaxID=35608 RepID=A0A2U1PBJ7_ARTAN|nr:Leucine-rich repeat-containing protein [Artemisia annua]